MEVVESDEYGDYFQRNAFEEEQKKVDGFVQKKVHHFYFVKFLPCQDGNLEHRIEEAGKLIEELNLEAIRMFEICRSSNVARDGLKWRLRHLIHQNSSMVKTLAWKSEVHEDLLEAVGKLNISRIAYRMRHCSNSLASENKLLRQIKETQQSGDDAASFLPQIRNLHQQMVWQSGSEFRDNKQIIVNEIEQLEQDANRSVMDYVRLINKISEGFLKEHFKVKNRIECVKREMDGMEKDRDNAMKQVHKLRLRQKKVNQDILQLKTQLVEHDGMKRRYGKYVSVINHARELARRNDVKALQELSLTEVGVFMSEWNENGTFRHTYEKSILPSFEKRQLSRNGRIKNEQLQ